MTKTDYALLQAAKAIIMVYETWDEVVNGTPPTPPKQTRQNAPTATSNDIPVCSVHGKAMRPSKYKEGQYYCGSKLSDGNYCREKG